MAASLLTSDTLRLVNVPRLADIATMARLLAQHGVTLGGDPDNGDEVPDEVPGADGVLHLRAETIASFVPPYAVVRKMRASVLVLGPLVARVGSVRLSRPAAWAVGNRQVGRTSDWTQVSGFYVNSWKDE